ncbi:MAG: cbb3-type cytochrome oxidase assembly protein CcoS [Verrucomicrobiota bacterium]
MEGWSNLLIVILVLASLLFASAVYALFWAAKNGQLKDFEESAKSIFTEEEPEGENLDSFPGKDKNSEP